MRVRPTFGIDVDVGRYEDLIERMPRSEAVQIEATVAASAKRLCPGVRCQVMTCRRDDSFAMIDDEVYVVMVKSILSCACCRAWCGHVREQT